MHCYIPLLGMWRRVRRKRECSGNLQNSSPWDILTRSKKSGNSKYSCLERTEQDASNWLITARRKLRRRKNRLKEREKLLSWDGWQSESARHFLPWWNASHSKLWHQQALSKKEDAWIHDGNGIEDLQKNIFMIHTRTCQDVKWHERILCVLRGFCWVLSKAGASTLPAEGLRFSASDKQANGSFILHISCAWQQHMNLHTEVAMAMSASI